MSIKNTAYCKVCKTFLWSKHRHDFVQCTCGNFIDGGGDYSRRGGNFADMIYNLDESHINGYIMGLETAIKIVSNSSPVWDEAPGGTSTLRRTLMERMEEEIYRAK